MTGHSTDITALRQRAITGWKALGTPAPLLFENDRAGAAVPASFVRFSVRPGSEEQTSLGGGRVRIQREGRVWLQIAFPVGTPDAVAWSLADKAALLFARWQSPDSALRCWEAETKVLPDTKHYIINVSVRYTSSRNEVAQQLSN